MRNSDTALLERWIRVRDPEAFAQIVDRHAGMVLSTCRRVLGNIADAEETTQDCFLQVSQAQRAITPSLGGWLHRVATNRALDRLRSDSARAAREKIYAAERPVSEEPVWNDIQPHVDAIIAHLPDELQVPLVLHFFEGQTHREVAKVLGLSRPAVTGRIQRAIAEIREQLSARNITLGVTVLSALFAGYEVHAASPSVVASLKKIGLAAGRPVVVPRSPWKGRLAVATAAIAVVATTLWATGVTDFSRLEVAASSPASPIGASSTSEGDVAEAAPIMAPTSGEIVLATAAADASAAVQSPAPEDKLRLRCVDEAGKSVEGAEVYYVRGRRDGQPMIQDNHPEDTKLEPFGPVLSDADGFVEVPALEEAGDRFSQFYSAYARVSDKLVGAWNYSPGVTKKTGWDSVVMVKSTRIGGTVTTPSGFDPAKVTVKVLTLRIQTGDIGYGSSFGASDKYRPPLWPALFSTAPDRDGSFSLGDIPEGQAYYLEFTAPGLGETQRYSFKANGDERLAVEMFPEATISGTVRYAAGGPAVDTPVFASPRGGRKSEIGVATPFQGRTDALGRYAIKGLPTENYRILVQHYGNPPSEISAVVPELSVALGEHRAGVDIVVEHGALQEGVLLDQETEQPIPDTWLIAMNPGDGENIGYSETIGASKTDSAGKFAFRLPTGVSFLYFMMSPEEYHYPKDQGRTFITVAPGQTELSPLTFHLAKKSEEEMQPVGEATIIGRVVDEEGVPLAGVPVTIFQKYKQGEDDRQDQTTSRPTGDDGRFSVKVRATGEHLIVLGEGGACSRTDSGWFAVEAGEEKSLGDIQVTAYDQIVVVMLTDYNDDPEASPPQASVRDRETDEHLMQDRFDAEGRIEFHVPSIPLKVTVGQAGYKKVMIDVEPGSEIEVALEPEE